MEGVINFGAVEGSLRKPPLSSFTLGMQPNALRWHSTTHPILVFRLALIITNSRLVELFFVCMLVDAIRWNFLREETPFVIAWDESTEQNNRKMANTHRTFYSRFATILCNTFGIRVIRWPMNTNALATMETKHIPAGHDTHTHTHTPTNGKARKSYVYINQNKLLNMFHWWRRLNLFARLWSSAEWERRKNGRVAK